MNNSDQSRQPPRTVVFKRKKNSTDVYESSGGTLGQLCLQGYGEEIEVVITPRLTVREQRAEVLRTWVALGCQDQPLQTALDALEAIDRRER